MSALRDESVQSNLARLEEIKTGGGEGQRWCLRATIQYESSNGALRDPVIYRCIVNSQDLTGTHQVSHHRTGTKWRVYPIFDFYYPLIDSIEVVTRALRTTEY
jgi:glutamyl/glutaminyl-tRNA synthetase